MKPIDTLCIGSFHDSISLAVAGLPTSCFLRRSDFAASKRTKHVQLPKANATETRSTCVQERSRCGMNDITRARSSVTRTSDASPGKDCSDAVRQPHERQNISPKSVSSRFSPLFQTFTFDPSKKLPMIVLTSACPRKPFQRLRRIQLLQHSKKEIHGHASESHCQQGGLCLVIGRTRHRESVIKESLQEISEKEYLGSPTVRTQHCTLSNQQ